MLPFTQFSLILRIECRTPTAYRHGVSGSFSLPSRGSFHLSLTVLFSIGHRVVFSLGRWSSLLPTGFLVSRGTLDHIFYLNLFRLQDHHLLRFGFPAVFGYKFRYPLICPQPHIFLYGLGSSAFARRYLRNHYLFSFPKGT